MFWMLAKSKSSTESQSEQSCSLENAVWLKATHYYCGQGTVEEEALGLVSRDGRWEFRGLSVI